MQETEFIWLNSKFVKWNEAKVHVLSHALHYGSAAFEGIRCYKTERGAAIFRLSEHIDRMLSSFKIFEVKCPYSKEQIEKAIKETLKVNKLQEAYIRPILFCGYGEMGLQNLQKCQINMAIAVWPWPAYLGDKPIKIKTSRFIRIHPKSLVADAKITGHYVNSILASIEARKAGFDEALLLDYKGKIAEGPGENIFIVKNKKIITPPLKGQILPGITRDSVIKIAKDFGYEVMEKELTLEEAKNADEVFMTGTAAEVTAISQIDEKIISNGNIGEITSMLRKAYSDVIHGKNSKYEKWLSYVK